MRKFVLEIFLFALVVLIVLLVACFALPGTRAKNSMLAHQIWIEKTLQETPGGRIILVGGSGVGNGFYSDDIAEAFNRNVINTGLHAGLGLIYQMKSVARSVKADDCVVLIPEYSNFNGTACWGDLELLSMVIDIIPADKELLDVGHYAHLLQFVPMYATTKIAGLLKRHRSFRPRKSLYGDFDWDGTTSDLMMPFPPAITLAEDVFVDDVIEPMKKFKLDCRNRGAAVYVFPPAFQRTSFEHQKRYIQRVSEELAMAGVSFAKEPQMFCLDNKYFYDTPYHLNLSGRKMRSQKMIEALKSLGVKKRLKD